MNYRVNYRGDARRIAGEINRILEHAPGGPEELQASMAQYACVLTSCYIETSLRGELMIYVSARVYDRHMLKFVESSLARLRNPKTDYILELIGRFGSDLRHRLEAKLDLSQRESIDSIYVNRNQIVHTGYSELSLAQVRKYFSDSEALVRKIREVLCAP